MTHATDHAATRGVAARAACLTAASAALFAAGCAADPTGVLKDVPDAGTTVADIGRSDAPNADLIPEQYIITLRSDVADVPGLTRQVVAANRGSLRFTYESAIKGFAAQLPAAAVAALQNNPNITRIEQDRLIHPTGVQTPPRLLGDRRRLTRRDRARPRPGTHPPAE